MPQPYVVTRPDSTILEANRGKALSVFVGEGRVRWLDRIRGIAESKGRLELAFRVRPRERAAVAVQARIVADDSTLRWMISAPATASNPAEGM